MKVTTAVIYAAGYGSRMLPVTAAVQKELLPILDRPVIDYVVEDCIEAGITNIIFVIRPNSHALQDYYVGNAGLESHLKRFGKEKAIAKLDKIHASATFNFVEQPDGAGYGTAVPLIVAIPHLPTNDAFIVCGGEDFLWRTDGGSDMAGMVKTFQTSGATGALLGLECPDEQLHRYGVLGVEEKEGFKYLKKFVEKPAPGEAPSNLINVSKYIMTPTMLKYVTEVKPDAASGELYITDAVRATANQHPVVVHQPEGEYLDAGTVDGWLKANLTVAESRVELSRK